MSPVEKSSLEGLLSINLLKYAKKSLRAFPWRNKEATKYEMLITEILLKRTTASKVENIWSEFFEQYPNISVLAKSDESEISQTLKPLGLFRQRASQLSALAKEIMEKFSGKIPIDHEDLLGLPGVGNYVSGAFLIQLGVPPDQLPSDVNVERVTTRLTGEVVFGENSKSLYRGLLAINTDKSTEVLYALLDVGSDVCRPLNPKCKTCPLKKHCHFPKNCSELNFTFTHKPKARPILVLSRKRWDKFKKESLTLQTPQGNLSKKFSSFVYVQRPVKAFTGKATCRTTTKGLEFNFIEEFKPRIPLNVVCNTCCHILLRSPITWASPGKKFDAVIEKIRSLIGERRSDKPI